MYITTDCMEIAQLPDSRDSSSYVCGRVLNLYLSLVLVSQQKVGKQGLVFSLNEKGAGICGVCLHRLEVVYDVKNERNCILIACLMLVD